EGTLTEGARVVIVDDVVTTGGSTIKAIESATEAGFEVVKVVALVDREEGGSENIRAAISAPFEAVFTRTELLNLKDSDAAI
ncbi:MAG: phosphoribosyltransferase family protein, partial [Thermodesulfobacteriota bacterium]